MFLSHLLARYHSCASDQPGRKVDNDVTIEVGHHHDVELVRIGDHLHRAVVHDHRIEFNLQEICYVTSFRYLN